ncbi:hypothetical protein C815_02054 [Firmicutes bacterium M10-2]|nr:hypothetical protein C815_02054 [Firmicutes bacterium M10-2]
MIALVITGMVLIGGVSVGTVIWANGSNKQDKTTETRKVDHEKVEEESKEEEQKPVENPDNDNTGNVASGNNGGTGSNSNSGNTESTSNTGSNTSKPSTGGNSSSQGSQKPSTPSHTHNWVQQYTTVHHAEKGHNEQYIVKEAWIENVLNYGLEERMICHGCGGDITDMTEDQRIEHAKQHMFNGGIT